MHTTNISYTSHTHSPFRVSAAAAANFSGQLPAKPPTPPFVATDQELTKGAFVWSLENRGSSCVWVRLVRGRHHSHHGYGHLHHHRHRLLSLLFLDMDSSMLKLPSSTYHCLWLPPQRVKDLDNFIVQFFEGLPAITIVSVIGVARSLIELLQNMNQFMRLLMQFGRRVQQSMMKGGKTLISACQNLYAV